MVDHTPPAALADMPVSSPKENNTRNSYRGIDELRIDELKFCAKTTNHIKQVVADSIGE